MGATSRLYVGPEAAVPPRATRIASTAAPNTTRRTDFRTSSLYAQILRWDDAVLGFGVYLGAMPWQPQRADLIAVTVLVTLAGSVGTGLGLAAANVRAKNGPHSAPLRMILRGSGNEVPSIQRDRYHFQRGLP
jgi:hypothetical protein